MFRENLAMHVSTALRNLSGVQHRLAELFSPIGAEVQWADPVTGSSKIVACAREKARHKVNWSPGAVTITPPVLKLTRSKR